MRETIKVSRPGDVHSVIVRGTIVELWVSSPTGDSTDSHIFTIPCRDNRQAVQVAKLWSDTWQCASGQYVDGDFTFVG